MSQYLIRQVKELENVDVRTDTDVVSLESDTHLRALMVSSGGTVARLSAEALFVCIGGVPRTQGAANVGFALLRPPERTPPLPPCWGPPPTAPRVGLWPVKYPGHSPPTSARRWWTNATAMDPSPMAAAQRLIDPLRTSPAANSPGRLVSRGKG